MSNNVSPAPKKLAQPLACALCQQRKVKCDREVPCANCVKASVPCIPSVPAPPRKRRRPNQDLRARLARCEELLSQYAEAGIKPEGPSKIPTSAPIVENSAGHTASSSSPLDSADESMRSTRGSDFVQAPTPSHLLIQQGGGSRLMDGHFWAGLYDELQNIRDTIDVEDNAEASPFTGDDGEPDTGGDLLVAGDDPSINLEDLQPEPVHAFRLWQLYLDRVNPLTKLIHVPSLQPMVMEAVSNINTVDLQHRALLFSIYTMAVLSTTEEEYAAMTSQARQTSLRAFRLGARLSLTRLNFLRNYNLTTVQALMLYLYSIDGTYGRDTSWFTSGVVVRIAQKMGLHRDGEVLKLTPFETEMRRRVWWQIIVQDYNLTTTSGSLTSLLPQNWDTKQPQNFNDADLFPQSADLVKPREGPTEMAFCLVVYRIYAMALNDYKSATGVTDAELEAAMLGQTPDGGNEPGKIDEILQRARDSFMRMNSALIELEGKYVDVRAGNVHVAAMSLRPMLMLKLEQMLLPIQEQPEWGTQIFTPEDKLFKILVLSHEHAWEGYEILAKVRFEWYIKLHFQLDVFGALTGQLWRRPTGSLSDRGWDVVKHFHDHYPDLNGLQTKALMTQARYTLRAWAARETAFAEAGKPLETPEFITRLRQSLKSLGSDVSDESPAAPPMPMTMAPGFTQQTREYDQLLGANNPAVMTGSGWGPLTGAVHDQIPQDIFTSFLMQANVGGGAQYGLDGNLDNMSGFNM